MGTFSIQMLATGATITKIGALYNTSAFSVTGGTFPLVSGDTCSGTHTGITNLDGSPIGTILFFINEGDVKITYSVNGTEVLSKVYGSGLAEINGPVIDPSDELEFVIESGEYVPPAPTPTPLPIEYTLDTVYYYTADGVSVISGITGTITANGTPMSVKVVSDTDVEFELTGLTITNTGSTFNLVLSASPEAGFSFSTPPVTGDTYDVQCLTGFTYVESGQPNEIWFTGNTTFWTGTTQTSYTEPCTVKYFTAGPNYSLQIMATENSGYFYILPD